MKWLFYLSFVFLLNPAYGQSKNGFDLSEALIPTDEIKPGGPPRDGIPSIDSPKFIDAKKAKNIFSKKERALIVEKGDEKKAYPISILNWHEIVNDKIDEFPIVVTFCPLCGTGIVFERNYRNKTLDFGVSGLLYQSDVLLYDRLTDSLWSQLLVKSVSGKYIGEKLKIVESSHINLFKYLLENPKAKVLSPKTGHQRDYARDPYENYDKTNKLYFPVNILDWKKKNIKTWSLLILSEKPRILSLNELKLSSGIKTIKIKDKNFKINYDKSEKKLLCLSKDYDCLTGYWFALKTFYPNAREIK